MCAGVRALLQLCPRVHVLHLLQCVGPFTAAMLPPAPSLASSAPPPAPGGALPPPPPPPALRARWTMTELLLCGPPCLLNDQALRQLLGPRRATLRALALCNVPLLTPSTLTFLAASHGATLRHLRLEQFGGGQVPAGAAAAAAAGTPTAATALHAMPVAAAPVRAASAEAPGPARPSPPPPTVGLPRPDPALPGYSAANGVTEPSASSRGLEAASPGREQLSASTSARTSRGGTPPVAWPEEPSASPLSSPSTLPQPTAATASSPSGTLHSPAAARGQSPGPALGLGAMGGAEEPRRGGGLSPQSMAEEARRLSDTRLGPPPPPPPRSPASFPSAGARVTSVGGLGAGGGGALGRHRPAASFWRPTESDLLELLAGCPGLLSLRLRHCCQVSHAHAAPRPCVLCCWRRPS